MRHTLRKLNTRLLALAVAVLLLLSITPRASADEIGGACGDDLTWSLSGDTLTISGSGEMYDFPESTMAPWYAYRTRIAVINLPDGLTRVGDLAFYGCTALVSVSLPHSVTEIGRHAFDGCTAMTMLALSDNLIRIEDAAFRECSQLKAVRLPGSLTAIGFQAFYRCESLTEIIIPASVTDLGMTTFSFCYDLVRAEIRASIEVLPDWTFYGCSRLTDLALPDTLTGADEYAFYECESLENIEYGGSSENLAQIRADIDRDLEKSATHIAISDTPNSSTGSSYLFEETEDGVISNTITTTTTDNAAISTNLTVTYPGGDVASGDAEAQIDITLENGDGWAEVESTLTDTVKISDSTQVDVYIRDGSAIPGTVLDSLAGSDVTLTVHSPEGGVWEVDCSTLEDGAREGEYSFYYQRTDATEEQLQLLGSEAGYQIRFPQTTAVNAEVMTRLSDEHARQIATLYQLDGKKLTLLQSVIVDDSGYAHFYLGTADQDTQYLIGIAVPGVDSESAIIPEVLCNDYGVTYTADGIEYVITGRTSSWNMNIWQVSGILAVVMVASVVTIGVVMFMLNKRKLKNGYVPDLEELEE